MYTPAAWDFNPDSLQPLELDELLFFEMSLWMHFNVVASGGGTAVHGEADAKQTNGE